MTTTLDAALQERVQRLLDRRVESLRDLGVADGAALVVDHHSGEILAWVDAGRFEDPDHFTARADRLALRVYTTRPDTSFGMTYAVVAPEHPLVDKLTINAYGVDMKLQELATFSVPEARQLIITPHDQANVEAIEKASRVLAFLLWAILSEERHVYHHCRIRTW